MNLIKRVKKNNKGFTLIEIIVVIVILAVLLAVAVPSVLNYLNEADDAKYMSQARAAYLVTQAELVKAWADGKRGNNDLKDVEAKIIDILNENQNVDLTNVRYYTTEGDYGSVYKLEEDPSVIQEYSFVFRDGYQAYFKVNGVIEIERPRN